MAGSNKKQLSDADVAKMRDIETYEHSYKKRTNNPPVGMAQHDTAPETRKTYAFDPHINPTLEWAGKTEGVSFNVPTSSIHIHESIKPHKIIRSVQTIGEDYHDGQLSFFEPMQVFFPLGGKNEGWARLAKTLKAEINQDLIEQYAGTESLPFTIDGGAMIAVKIIDDRGIESLKVLKVGG